MNTPVTIKPPKMPPAWQRSMERDAARYPGARSRAECRERHRQRWADYWRANKDTPEFQRLFRSL